MTAGAGLEPLPRCGCGGYAEPVHPAYAHQAWAYRCNVCGIETKAFADDGRGAEAAWRNAMRARPAPDAGMMEALLKYGHHLPDCALREHRGHNCDCGWGAKRAALRPAQEDGNAKS